MLDTAGKPGAPTKLTVRVGQPAEGQVELIVLVRDGSARVGVLEIVVDTRSPTVRLDLASHVEASRDWSSETTVILLSARPATATDGEPAVRYWPMVPEIDVLP